MHYYDGLYFGPSILVIQLQHLVYIISLSISYQVHAWYIASIWYSKLLFCNLMNLQDLILVKQILVRNVIGTVLDCS